MKRLYLKVAALLTLTLCVIASPFTFEMKDRTLAVTSQEAQAQVHPMNGDLILAYVNTVIFAGIDPVVIIYPYPGFHFVANDETEFNTIVFDDPRLPGGFTWSDWQSLNDTAYQWNYDYVLENRLIDTVASVDALVASTVNGHSLPGTVVVTKANVGLGNVDNTADADKPVSTATTTALGNKVDKVTGKGLSQEDFSTTLKNKLDAITAGATANSDSQIRGLFSGTSGISYNSTTGVIQPSYGTTTGTVMQGDDARLGEKSVKANFTALSSVSAHGISNGATDAATNAATDAATDAATNAPTNLNVVTTLLGSLTGEVNATNTKQNDLAAKYNALAAKYNDLATKSNAESTKYNDLSGKFNTLLTKFTTMETAVNNLKAAGAL